MTALSLVASSSRSALLSLPRLSALLPVQTARTALTSRIISLSSAPVAQWYLAIPGLASLLELLPPIVLAVPKHKVTHSRKSMRSANKGLKNKSNFSQCEACGGVKLAHNICPSCYSQISRKWKSDARSLSGNGSNSMGSQSGHD